MKLSLATARLFCGAAFVLLLAAAAAAAPPDKEIATVYSDLCYNDASGDVDGERLLLVDAYTYKFVILQWAADNKLRFPQAVEAKIAGDQIEFQVADLDGKALTFKGEITPEAITGSFTINPAEKSRYRRVTNEIRAVPDCGADTQ
ncbi:MAG: hypothetical protein JO128_05235 [Alphaproteobacteria bacterium]|nr:hypothetical protein [Alphaproteobacteria bacterium]